MTDRPSATAPLSRRAAIGGGLMLGFLALLAVGLLALVLLGQPANAPGAGAAATPTADPASFAYGEAIPAPPLELTDQDGQPFTLASQLGRPVLAFFGYTHCPDVCPTTLADLRAGIRESGVDATVAFVTIDPARDDAAAMKQYTDYYKAGYTGLTGTADEIAEAAEAWGVSYQQLPSDSASGYAMAHSTDAYLVDAEGQLRHHLFYGAGVDLIAETLREVDGR